MISRQKSVNSPATVACVAGVIENEDVGGPSPQSYFPSLTFSRSLSPTQAKELWLVARFPDYNWVERDCVKKIKQLLLAISYISTTNSRLQYYKEGKFQIFL